MAEELYVARVTTSEELDAAVERLKVLNALRLTRALEYFERDEREALDRGIEFYSLTVHALNSGFKSLFDFSFFQLQLSRLFCTEPQPANGDFELTDSLETFGIRVSSIMITFDPKSVRRNFHKVQPV